jgi:hypothetical protein
MKDGNTTDLTVERYASLEAYLCDDRGVESVELAIYNYKKQSGPFSAKGHSGSLHGEGHMVGILHSGMRKARATRHQATPAGGPLSNSWSSIRTPTPTASPSKRDQRHRLSALPSETRLTTSRSLRMVSFTQHPSSLHPHCLDLFIYY